ncbi:MAG: hypothetical protein IID44_10035 [Planctomycetes bacterium]|nr:hypothetical protein [Planctomycetota bacterium]
MNNRVKIRRFARALSCVAAVALLLLVPYVAADDKKGDADAKKPKPKAAAKMTNARLGALLKKRFDKLGGREGFWIVPIEAEKKGEKDILLMIVTDERANRMRIMMPVRKFDKDKDKDLLLKLLKANFHSALDAKYAVNGDTIWSTFLHPLATLQEADLDNALSQVRTLRKNTGTSYSSGELQFGGGEPEKQPQPDL